MGLNCEDFFSKIFENFSLNWFKFSLSLQKKPRYVAPSTSNNNIQPLNSARGRNNYRHLLVVGRWFVLKIWIFVRKTNAVNQL